MNKYILFAVVATAISTTVFSKELDFSVRAAPESIKLGDRIVFTFSYRNTSGHDLGIYPEYYAYEALDTYFSKVEGDRKGERIPYHSPPHFDCAVVAKNYHILRPGQTYSRTLVATLSS